MNNLSWLIYLADLTGSISTLLGFIGVVLIAISVVLIIYGASMKDHMHQENTEWKRGHEIQVKALKKLVPLAFFSFFLSTVLPSSNTVYAIAASETGEEVLDSETGGLAVEALNSWLHEQIDPDKETE